MIAKKNRFHGHNSVSRVRGQKAQGSNFSVYYTSNQKRADYRMAVVVSKKISKSAVVRNRIRRRLFESVRTQEILNRHNIDVVFVVHDEELAKISPAELNAQVSKVCKKIIQPR